MGSNTQTRNLKLVVTGDPTGGNKALQSVADTSDQTTGKISKSFGNMFSTLGSTTAGFLGPVSEAFNVAGDAVSGYSEKHDGLTAKMAITGGAAMTLGGILTGAAATDMQAQAQLQTAIENTGQSYDDFESQIDSVIKHQENFGNSAADTQNALQTLVQATGDMDKALSYMGTVADLAAAKHESLGTAATQVAQILGGKGSKVLASFGLAQADVKKSTDDLTKAQQDSVRANENVTTAEQKLADLEARQADKKKLSISDEQALRDAKNNVTDALDKQRDATSRVNDAQTTANQATTDQADLMDRLSQKINGQAAASMDNWRGKLDIIKTKIEDEIAVLGKDYGPALTVAGTAITTLAAGMEIAKAITERMTAAKLAAAAASEAEAAANTEVAITGTAAATAEAAAAWPLWLIVAAIGAVVLGIYELATHWDDVMLGMSVIANTAEAGIDSAFRAISKSADLAVKDIKGSWEEFDKFFSGFPGRMASIDAGMWNWLGSGFTAQINSIVGLWNRTVGSLSFTIPSWVPQYGGDNFSVPKIPTLDTGGIVTGPTLAALSMNSVPEAIIPLPQLQQMVDDGKRSNQGRSSDGSGNTFIVNANTNADAREIAREQAWNFKTSIKKAS